MTEYANRKFTAAVEVVTLNEAVPVIMPDPLGGIDDIANAIGVQRTSLAIVAGQRHGSFPLKIGPRFMRPMGVAVAVNERRANYGPWEALNTGAPGKVYVEHDESLNPWQCGGSYEIMNLTAQAKIANVATFMQEAETGTIQQVGLPRFQPGDAIVEGGPNVTGIEIELNTSGISTTTSCTSFTPTFGAFSKSKADFLLRLGLWQQSARRKIRDLWNRERHSQQVAFAAQQGAFANFAHAVAQQSPICSVSSTYTKSDKYGWRCQSSLSTIDEMLANCRTDDPSIYSLTGGSDLTALLRAYSTNPNQSQEIPHLEFPIQAVDGDCLTSTRIHPFTGSDVDIVLGGDQASPSLHRLKGQQDPNDLRGVGLRMPLVGVGFGMELTGKPFPNKVPHTQPLQEWSSDYAVGGQADVANFVAGPIGLHWCVHRKIWTVPHSLRGTLDTALVKGGSALMTMMVGSTALTDKVLVYLDLSPRIEAGKLCYATYDGFTNRWMITSTEC